MEVIYAILKYRGITMEEVDKVRLDKQKRKGGFERRVYLKEVEE